MPNTAQFACDCGSPEEAPGQISWYPGAILKNLIEIAIKESLKSNMADSKEALAELHYYLICTEYKYFGCFGCTAENDISC